MFTWEYFYLSSNGRIVDEDGYEMNTNSPSFDSVEEADAYLSSEDIRGNVVGRA